MTHIDPDCLELAENYLPPDAPETKDLAIWIQRCILDWLEQKELEARTRAKEGM